MLREAEADARDSLEYLPPARAPLVIAFLLDVLIEHHNLEPADEMLERFNLAGDLPEMILTTFVLERRGRLRIAQGHHEQALEDLLLCRRRSIEWGATSPAFLPWRSTLAMALHHLHRRGEAVELAAEEVLQAQEFGAARAFGAALRVQGLVSGGAAGLALLERAASVLSGSGAPLEHARALVDLGAALRDAGTRKVAREHLRVGVVLAQECGATTLARRARVELRKAGGRPTQPHEIGVDALSASEFRVAKMAASGTANREIAQALFVTTKTVEWHLSQAYRKLQIGSRAELPDALSRPGVCRGSTS